MMSTGYIDSGLRGPALLCAPASWNQTKWHCGTTHCIAGHCELRAGGPTSQTQENVQELLGISYVDAAYLFSSRRTLVEIYQFAKVFRDACDHVGHDRDGAAAVRSMNCYIYDRVGYDRAGTKLDLVPFEL